MKAPLHVHIMLFIVQLIYASNYPIIKTIVPSQIGPKATVLFRVVGALIFFWIVASFVKRETVVRKDMIKIALCAVFGVFTNQVMFLEGISRTSAINASLIMITVPIIVLLLSYFFLKELLTWQKILGVILGFIGGTILIVGGQKVQFSQEGLVGDLFILTNATSFSIYIILVKTLMDKYHPLTVIKWLFLFGTLFVAPVAFNEFRAIDFSVFNNWTYFVLFWIIFFVTCMAYLLYISALKKAPASLVGSYIFLQPLLTSVLAVHIIPWLGKVLKFQVTADELTPVKIIAGLIIFTGLGFVIFGGRSKRRAVN